MNYLRNVLLNLATAKKYAENKDCLFHIDWTIRDMKNELIYNVKHLEYELEEKRELLKLIDFIEGKGVDKNES